jgi:hypothetical protein
MDLWKRIEASGAGEPGIFFTNDNDTINYQKMIVEMDKLIRDGVINPLKVLDKHNNLHRLKSPLAGVYHATSKDLKQSVLTACVGDDDDDYDNERFGRRF